MSDSFATLFSFATELRASLNAQDAALLDALLNREEVVTGADLDIWATNETNDAGVAQDVFSAVRAVHGRWFRDQRVREQST